MLPHESYLEWETLEHPHVPRTVDWYWAVGLLAVSIAVASFMLDNPLFGIFILLAAILMAVHAHKGPRIVTCKITKSGIVYHNKMYPFSSLSSFWIHEDRLPHRLVISSEHHLVPHIHIPIENTDPADIRDALLNHIDEARHKHSLMEALAELLEHYL
jgi:hypothetical protein